MLIEFDFSGAGRSLIVFQMMFGKAQESPCPMCTLWIDGFAGVGNHIAENVDLVVVAAAGLPELRAHARDRGWNGMRLLSAGENSFKFDLGSEDADGNQSSTISVFDRGATARFATPTPFSRSGAKRTTNAGWTYTTRFGTCST